MLPTSFQTHIDDTWTGNKDALGTIRFQGGKWYKCVQFNNGQGNVAAAVGNLCYYYLDSGGANSIVTSDLTDKRAVAGAFVSVPADLEKCWILIKGYMIANQALAGSAENGDPLAAGSTNGQFTRAIEADSAGPYKQVVGVAQVASAKSLFLDCPF